MHKTFLLLLLFACSLQRAFSQCPSSITPPDCSGTEPSLSDNEILSTGTSKWYYGPPTTMNSVTLDGGTLVVCGDLTIDKFYMNSGTVFIRQGARFVISSGIGAGLILTGNSYIYNYGTCEIQRNLSFDVGATASAPNIVVNATPTAVFKMSNQYFVINAAHSWFVNNGTADFWGIITDPLSSPGAICLGDGSSTRMAVLINKVADTYRVPTGSACVNVHQFSQFSNRLTPDPGVYVCLGSSHNSYSGCGGCPANNWGMAQVFTACSACSALSVLGSGITNFSASRTEEGFYQLRWEINSVSQGSYFRILRSTDGIHYQVIDSMIVKTGNLSSFYSIDKKPSPGNNYYMINYIDPAGMNFNSKVVKVQAEKIQGFDVYPTPFKNDFQINYPGIIEQVILTDMLGRNVAIKYSKHRRGAAVMVQVQEKIQAGIYIVHIRTKNNVMAKTIFKE